MKNGLLICRGSESLKNIGDYIQSVAQEQFIGRDYCYVEREELNIFKSDDKTNVIMNGWFMWNPENFPPSKCINPLFISFHIAPSISSRFFTKETIEYLQKYSPIGARDIGTMHLLQSHGIDSYFSGCLTLTLGNNYKSDTKNDSIIFVDPYFELGGNNYSSKLSKLWHALFFSYKHRKVVSMFYKKFSCEFHSKLGKLSLLLEKYVMAASFYESYRTAFSDELIINAKFISHSIEQSEFKNDEAKMEYARELIKEYANAKLIITSRIHSALPALGVETPVIFVNSEKLRGESVRSSGRFDGLVDLMHEMEWTTNGLIAKSSELNETIKREGVINKNTQISILLKYKKYADEMTRIVLDFIGRNKDIN